MTQTDGTVTVGRAAFEEAGFALATERVPVPRLGGDVVVREMTGSEQDSYDGEMLGLIGPGGRFADAPDWRSRLVVRCACGDDGALLFDPASPGDLALVAGLPAADLLRLHEACQRVNKQAEGDGDDLEGNSDAATGGASSSGSPSHSGAPGASSSHA
jgi:hypothetical protein